MNTEFEQFRELYEKSPYLQNTAKILKKGGCFMCGAKFEKEDIMKPTGVWSGKYTVHLFTTHGISLEMFDKILEEA